MAKNDTNILNNITLAVETKFGIQEISMKNDWRWKIKMRVNEILPKTHHDYSIKLKFDPSPYELSIEQLKKERDEIDTHPTLAPDLDKKDMRRLTDRIAKVQEEMEKYRKECYDIDFVTTSEEIKYKGSDTYLLFKVLDTVIEPLNDRKMFLDKYVAVLDPIIK